MSIEINDNSIKGVFSFYPAGQGGFYAGGVYINDTMTLSVVYDCGTLSKKESIEQSIHDFNNLLIKFNNRLNILVISHLDADHVNKLKILLTNIKQVDLIVLPYISRITSILYGIRSLNNILIKDKKFYIDFITNPISTIENITQIGKFMFVSPNKCDDSDVFYDQIKISDENNEKNTLKLKGKINKILEEKLEKVYGEKYNDKIHVIDKELDLIMLDSNNAYVWLFKFWESEVQYRKNISGFFKELKLKHIDVSSMQNIRNALINNQKELRDIYRKNSFSINNTSIVLYHSPTVAEMYYGYVYLIDDLTNQINDCFCKDYLCGMSGDILSVGRSGTLLMGDINLKENYDELIKYFENEMNNLFIVTLPHHGSKNNWYYKFYKKYCAWLYVAQAGFSSKFSHPSYEVVCGLQKYNRRFCIVNEFKKVTYIIECKR